MGTMKQLTELLGPKFSILNLMHWCHQPGLMNNDPIKLQLQMPMLRRTWGSSDHGFFFFYCEILKFEKGTFQWK